jgi:hypothetical protein
LTTRSPGVSYNSLSRRNLNRFGSTRMQLIGKFEIVEKTALPPQ